MLLPRLTGDLELALLKLAVDSEGFHTASARRLSTPYQVPGIVALPILGGSADYLAWIEQETRAPDHP